MKHFFAPLLTILSLLLLPGVASADVLFEGELQQDSYFTKLEGNWRVEERDGQTQIVFADNFSAKKAPDLKIFLSSLPLDEINGKNAASAEHATLVAELNSYNGTVSFTVPDGIDVSAFQSLIVHCEQYAKLWGGSTLR